MARGVETGRIGGKMLYATLFIVGAFVGAMVMFFWAENEFLSQQKENV